MPLEEGDTFFFAPRPLRNLVLVDEMDSLSPIMACQVKYFIKYEGVYYLRNLEFSKNFYFNLEKNLENKKWQLFVFKNIFGIFI